MFLKLENSPYYSARIENANLVIKKLADSICSMANESLKDFEINNVHTNHTTSTLVSTAGLDKSPTELMPVQKFEFDKCDENANQNNRGNRKIKKNHSCAHCSETFYHKSKLVSHLKMHVSDTVQGYDVVIKREDENVSPPLKTIKLIERVLKTEPNNLRSGLIKCKYGTKRF